jgi:hypothetical protein
MYYLLINSAIIASVGSSSDVSFFASNYCADQFSAPKIKWRARGISACRQPVNDSSWSTDVHAAS